jgi:hypothetical protein
MNEKPSSQTQASPANEAHRHPELEEVAESGKRIGKHVVSVIVGLLLLIVAFFLSATLMLLPIGLPLGVIGVFMILWGMFVWTRAV